MNESIPNKRGFSIFLHFIRTSVLGFKKQSICSAYLDMRESEQIITCQSKRYECLLELELSELESRLWRRLCRDLSTPPTQNNHHQTLTLDTRFHCIFCFESYKIILVLQVFFIKLFIQLMFCLSKTCYKHFYIYGIDKFGFRKASSNI